METLSALLTGFLFAAAVYQLLQRDLSNLLVGLILMSHASNLLILTAAGLVHAQPPLIGHEAGAQSYADPVPQALVLTAIVISFGLTGFTLVLAYLNYQEARIRDLDSLKIDDI